MTLTNLPTQITALLFSLAYTTVVLAEDTPLDEDKNNSAGHTISNANPAGNVSSDNKPATVKQTDTAPQSSHMKLISDMKEFQQMEKQWYQQRREAYKQQLENRNLQRNTDSQVPADVESRRNDYIRHMEQRREFFNKLNEQRRKEFEQRREEMQQRIHQTRSHIDTTDNS